jgi:hypothetical protein
MEKITEKELVERFGTDTHLKQYEESGKLVGWLKQRVMERAKKCCDVTPLEHKMYKLTAIKSDQYVNKSIRTNNDVYKNLLPVLMSVFNFEKSSRDWRLIALKANIVDPRLFVWSRNSIIISEVSGKTIDETYAFFGKVKEFVKYYIVKGVEYLINDRFITCNPVWREFITTEQLYKYYSRAKEIYFPYFIGEDEDDKEVARKYYEDYLGELGEGDLHSLVNKDANYAVFLIMYLLMLKDNITVKVLTKSV